MQLIALLSLRNNNGVAKEGLPAAEPLCKCTIIPCLLNNMVSIVHTQKILFTKETFTPQKFLATGAYNSTRFV